MFIQFRIDFMKRYQGMRWSSFLRPARQPARTLTRCHICPDYRCLFRAAINSSICTHIIIWYRDWFYPMRKTCNGFWPKFPSAAHWVTVTQVWRSRVKVRYEGQVLFGLFTTVMQEKEWAILYLPRDCPEVNANTMRHYALLSVREAFGKFTCSSMMLLPTNMSH